MKKIIPKSEYARNSFISVAGVAVATLIPLALMPVLGRIYTPEQFNTQGLFLNTTSLLAIAANLRYGQAVAVADTDAQARNLLVGSLWLSFFFSIACYLILFFCDTWIIHTANILPGNNYLLYLAPLSTFFISAYIGLNSWLTRQKKFTGMAVNKIVRRGGEGFFQLILGKLKYATGYTLGTFLGDVVNFIVNLVQFKRAKGYFVRLNPAELKRDLRLYSDFPKHNLIPSLLDTASLFLPFFYVNIYFDNALSGQFYQCTAVLGFPLTLISMTLSQVLLQRLTENKLNSKPVYPILYKHIVLLSLLAVTGVLILFFFGEFVFVMVLGDQWALAGQMASILVLAYAAKFVIGPLSVIFFSHQELKKVSYWQYARFAVIGSFFLFDQLTIWQFIWLNVFAEAVLYGIYLAMIVILAKRYDKSL